ncbi:MAG TPA: universal stress protein [Ilumatobacter sp.]|nr:universal stress protein [Ilumatobacter sp.]
MTNSTPATPPEPATGPPTGRVGVDPFACLVVGVDGSPNSLATLEWASGAAAPGGQIHVVVSVATRLGLSAIEPGAPTTIDDLQARLDGEWGHVARSRDVGLTAHVVDDRPADALLHVAGAQHADAIVVGAHAGLNRPLRLIGRTITKLLRRSPVALVIVPEQAVLGDDRDTIVLGVGQSDASTAAMRWAADWANARHARVAVVNAVSTRPTFTPEGLFVLLAHVLDPSVLHDWAQDDADRFAEQLQQLTDADTDITTSVVDGSAGARLVEAGQQALLLVIGRGKPSAVHHSIAHAPCPVVVIAGEGEHDDAGDDDTGED